MKQQYLSVNNEVKAKYPSDWKSKKLGDLGRFLKGKGISKADTSDSGIPCILYGEIYTKHHVFIKKFKSFIDEQTASMSMQIEKGDILFTGSGETKEEIGKPVTYLYDKEAFAGGDIIILRPRNVNSLFLSYLLNSNELVRERAKLAQGHSVVHIYPKELESIKVHLPSLLEQQKIADILFTWDKAIELKEKLIEQKNEQKKGLMQKLLTGRVRLPGFKEKWKEINLGKIATLIMGQSPSSKSYNNIQEGLPLIQGNADCKDRKTVPRIWTSQPTKTCEVGDIIMTVRAPVGYVSRSIHEACIGRGVCAIRGKINQDYLYYQLIFKEDWWGRISQGSTFDSVNSNDIKELKILVPSDKEQEAIANILILFDQELDYLERELEQIKQQKKGLMQFLLTGKVRAKV